MPTFFNNSNKNKANEDIINPSYRFIIFHYFKEWFPSIIKYCKIHYKSFKHH